MVSDNQELILSDVEGFLRDESRKTGWAESISFPRSEDDVQKILAILEGKTPVTIQGARTGISAGAVPFGGHIMNLSRQTRILGMRLREAGRFSLIVQPGVILSVLNESIAGKEFDTGDWDDESIRAYAAFKDASPHFFPPDPTETSATVGGMVACNASGAKSYLYGAMRGYVGGLRVVLSDGEVVSLRRGDFIACGRSLSLDTESGKSRMLELPSYMIPKTKSASGYYITDNMDAVDLFIGMDGTFGVITQLELSLIPLPDTIWGAIFYFTAEAQALDFVIRARGAGGKKVAALEYFDSNILDILRRQKLENPAFLKLPIPPERYRHAIFADLHCVCETEAFDELLRLEECMENAGGNTDDIWAATEPHQYDEMIEFRHAAPECVNMIIDHRKKDHPGITKLGTDLSVPDDYLLEVMSMYRTTLSEFGLEYAIWGHIGNNHVHVNILPRDEADFEAGKALCIEWAKRAVAMGGAVSAEHGIGKLKTEQFAMMYSNKHFAEMRALKLALDPGGIFGRNTIFPWG